MDKQPNRIATLKSCIAIGVSVFLCLTFGVKCSAAEEICTPIDDSTFGIIDTDKGVSYIIKPLWQNNLSNDDGDQNQQSIALGSDRIFVCVDYYETERKGNLFLRTFSKTTGEPGTITMPLPSGWTSQSPVIFNDQKQNVYISQPYYDTADRNIKIRICPLQTDAGNTYGSETTVTTNITANNIKSMVLETVSDVTLEDDVLSFTTVIEYDNSSSSSSSNTFNFRLLRIKHNLSTGSTISVDNYNIKLNDWYNISALRIAFATHPDEPNSIYVCTKNISNAKKKFYPTLINISNDGKITEVGDFNNLSTLNSSNWDWTNDKRRGVFTFSHQGNPMMVVPNSTKQFCLLTIPNATSLDGIAEQTLLPVDQTYNGSGKTYQDMHQLAITEKGANFNAIGKRRAALESECTNLYVYAPGSGVGAYAIGTPDTWTSLNDVESDHNDATLSGTTLYLTNHGIRSVELYDMQGRLLRHIEVVDGKAELAGTHKGLCVAKVGTTSLKLNL